MKILSADVGGTYIKFATMNENAEIFSRGKIPTPQESYEDFLKAIYEIFLADDFEGVALSLPGIIDAEEGFCVTSAALKYNGGKFIVRDIEKICGVKVSVENDANCAALAEAKIGSLADVEDGFIMVFGTMIGGSFIKNHELHRGKNFLAGEVSFLMQSFAEDFSDKKFFWQDCSVGSLLENFMLKKNLSKKISGEDFFRAIENFDSDALNCLENFTKKIALQIFNIQMILDIEKVAIGGGISEQKIFIESIRKSMKEVYKQCPINFPKVEIVPCKFRNDANLIGAVFSWLNKNFL